MAKVQRSEQEWRAKLDPDRYAVLREAATEPPFSGEHTFNKQPGLYRCAGCGRELFAAEDKFESGSGWPSFTRPRASEAVTLHEDRSHFMVRTEVRCADCGGHLGHVFDDGPAPTGQRYCINSLALAFEPRD